MARYVGNDPLFQAYVAHAPELRCSSALRAFSGIESGYQVLADGTVQIPDGAGGWTTPWPTPAEQALFDTQVARWAPLAIENEIRTGVPAPWTLAIIYGESAGLPDAHGPPSDFGIGLMMITSVNLRQGHSVDEVFDPAINVQLGTDFLRTLMTQYGATDIAKAASEFNCGPGARGPKSNPSAPYGYCEYQIPGSGAYPYVSKVVRLQNYAIGVVNAQRGLASGGAGPLALVAFAGLAFLAVTYRRELSQALGLAA